MYRGDIGLDDGGCFSYILYFTKIVQRIPISRASRLTRFLFKIESR